MSYIVNPEIHVYFSKEPDLRVNRIAEAMRRGRFYAIRTALHFANNLKCPDKSDPLHDRAWKIRPLIIHFNKAFQTAMSPTYEEAIDERMTKFKGPLVMKQYMKDKPIKRGFKHWCRNDSKTGYMFEFDIYVGKKTTGTEYDLSESVVLQLTKSLVDSCCQIFFDSFYTSSRLVYRFLKERSIYTGGTVKKNRKSLPKNMKSSKEMEKGEIEARYFNGVSVVKWIDVKPAVMMFTIDSGDKKKTLPS